MDSLNIILEKDESIELNWKHNLGSGAIPEIIENNIDLNLTELAQKVMKTLDMKFASVDIIKTVDGRYKVMEINSGVMLTNFALNDEKGYKLAKNIYKKVIKLMMGKELTNGKI